VWHVFVGDEDRFTYREVRNGKGLLIDFSLCHGHWIGPGEDDWAEIVRVDCDHGEVHRHSFGPNGTRRKWRDILGYDDIEAAVGYAEKTVVQRFDENLRRWEYGSRA
jgi:hypothetical protein